MSSKTLTERRAVSVEAKSLTKSFNGQRVLDDLSFTVNPGEIFVIMGPSGAGKSVLLKSIIGLENPSSGKILINGHDTTATKTHQEISSALVFQDGALFNSMNVFDNLALYPREHRLYKASVLREKVDQTLKMLSLNGSENKFPSELSGGMRKRVAIARALVMEPQLLLYDEPTSELDPTLSATISEIIAYLRDTLKITSIVVSHDRDLSLTIADRVALLINGRIITIDTPAGLRASDDPAIKKFLNPQIDIAHPRFLNGDSS